MGCLDGEGMTKNLFERPITDRSLPTVTTATGISRDLYDEFGKIAAARGLTRAALLRQLIQETVDKYG